MHDTFVYILSELRSAWRFRWIAVAVAWIICLPGWAWVAMQPNVYEASANVYVDTASVLEPLLGDQIVDSDVETQLAYVRQALLGREHLERVASETNLDVRATTAAGSEQVIQSLRSNISISSSESGRGQGSTYGITYRNTDPDAAVGVVRTLLDSFVEDTLGQRRQGSDAAGRFLDERIVEYEKRLQEAEQALADFRRRNAERLPSAEGTYFEEMQTVRGQLRQAERELRIARSRRDRLEQQLNSESAVVAGSGGGEPPPNSIDARIREQRAELDRLLLEYTEQHPDVRNARASLEQLEQQRAERLQQMGVNDSDQELSNLESNPVHQELQIALNTAEVEIATLEADVQEYRNRLEELQSVVEEVPEVEAELARLNRDYDIVYEQYQELIRSRERQELSSKASDTDQVDFRVINAPRADSDPVAPQRLNLLAMIFFAGFGGGGGLAYLLAQLRPVFGDTRSLREITELPLLGAVTHVAISAGGKWKQRCSTLSFAAAVIALTFVFAAAVGIEVAGPGLYSLTGGS